ncbi:MAG TPA: hypothetical protein VNR87_07165 [Flavisolibacter sp.]|nr:hypothetical protein [Flavisolibacter sp.]
MVLVFQTIDFSFFEELHASARRKQTKRPKVNDIAHLRPIANYFALFAFKYSAQRAPPLSFKDFAVETVCFYQTDDRERVEVRSFDSQDLVAVIKVEIDPAVREVAP